MTNFINVIEIWLYILLLVEVQDVLKIVTCHVKADASGDNFSTKVATVARCNGS